MIEFDFERQAMKGEPLPEGLDVADSCLYIGLKYLYAMYKRNLITRDKASEEKQILIRAWTLHKSQLKFLHRESERLRDRIQTASKEHKNKPSIETGDKLYAAFYGLPENWREQGSQQFGGLDHE